MAERVLLGRIAGAHGVRGEVRLTSFTERPEAIAEYGPLSDRSGRRQFALALRGRVRGENLVAAIAGIDDRNAAEALAGTELYVDRAQLPPTGDEGEYYHVDLVGLRVEDPAGRELGRVTSVADYGAGPMLEIRSDAGGELLLAFTDAVVPTVDIAGGRLVALPPPEIEVRPGRADDGLEGDGAPEGEPAEPPADTAESRRKGRG
jgi:16S rRNA processing protein RimM